MKYAIIQINNIDDYHCAIIDNHNIHINQHVPLEQLNDTIDGLKCYILAPAGDVRLTEVAIPKTSQTKLAKAVPYALEDNSIDDIDDLHFALGKYNQHGMLPVAIVRSQLMTQWLQALRQQHIYADSMLPFELSLPYQENHWHLCVTEQQAFIRTGKDSGFCVEKDQLNAMLHLLFNEGHSKPQAIDISYTSELADALRQQLAKLAIPTTIAEKATDVFHLSQQGLQQTTSINLLQAPYQLNKARLQSSRLWHWCAYLGIAFCGIWLAAQITQISLLSHRSQQLTTQINQSYFQVFPNAQTVTSVRLRIERALQENINSQTGGAFLGHLLIIGQQLKAANNAVTIKTINFDNNRVVLDLSSQNFSQLNRFISGLKSQGLSANQSNARTENNQVSARLTIEGGGR